jgi:hypothetical protein
MDCRPHPLRTRGRKFWSAHEIKATCVSSLGWLWAVPCHHGIRPRRGPLSIGTIDTKCTRIKGLKVEMSGPAASLVDDRLLRQGHDTSAVVTRRYCQKAVLFRSTGVPTMPSSSSAGHASSAGGCASLGRVVVVGAAGVDDWGSTRDRIV